MGVDWHAYAVLGVKVPGKIKSRGCTHPETPNKFCPECGKKMWSEELERHPILENIESSNHQFIVWSTEYDYAFVGVCVDSGSNRRNDEHFNKIDFADDYKITELKKVLKKMLKDLYQEKNFGLWSVLYCSY